MPSGVAAAPAHIEGYTEYSVPRPGKSPAGFRGLKTHSGGHDLAFDLPGCNAKYAGDAGGPERPVGMAGRPSEGPEQAPLAATPVDFGAPDGRRLPGNVPTHALQNLATQEAVHASTSLAARDRTTGREVGLGAVWPLTLPRRRSASS